MTIAKVERKSEKKRVRKLESGEEREREKDPFMPKIMTGTSKDTH